MLTPLCEGASEEEAGVLAAAGLRLFSLLNPAGGEPRAGPAGEGLRAAGRWVLDALAGRLRGLETPAGVAAGLPAAATALVDLALRSSGTGSSSAAVRRAAQVVLLSLPDPQAPALQLLSQSYAALHPGATAAVAAARQAATTPAVCFEVDEDGGLQSVAAPAACEVGALQGAAGAAPAPGEALPAALAAVEVMGSLARACSVRRAEFLARLAGAQTSAAAVASAGAAPREAAGGAAGRPPGAAADVDMESFDYMEVRGRAGHRWMVF